MDETLVRIRPKHWWSIRAWKKAKIVQSLTNQVLQRLLQQRTVPELLTLDWKEVEKEIKAIEEE